MEIFNTLFGLLLTPGVHFYCKIVLLFLSFTKIRETWIHAKQDQGKIPILCGFLGQLDVKKSWSSKQQDGF